MEAKKIKKIILIIVISGISSIPIFLVVRYIVLILLFGLYFAVQGILSPIVAALLMPISSISVVAFASFTTSYFARNKESKDLNQKEVVLPSIGKLSKKRVQLN